MLSDSSYRRRLTITSQRPVLPPPAPCYQPATTSNNRNYHSSSPSSHITRVRVRNVVLRYPTTVNTGLNSTTAPPRNCRPASSSCAAIQFFACIYISLVAVRIIQHFMDSAAQPCRMPKTYTRAGLSRHAGPCPLTKQAPDLYTERQQRHTPEAQHLIVHVRRCNHMPPSARGVAAPPPPPWPQTRHSPTSSACRAGPREIAARPRLPAHRANCRTSTSTCNLTRYILFRWRPLTDRRTSSQPRLCQPGDL